MKIIFFSFFIFLGSFFHLSQDILLSLSPHPAFNSNNPQLDEKEDSSEIKTIPSASLGRFLGEGAEKRVYEIDDNKVVMIKIGENEKRIKSFLEKEKAMLHRLQNIGIRTLAVYEIVKISDDSLNSGKSSYGLVAKKIDSSINLKDFIMSEFNSLYPNYESLEYVSKKTLEDFYNCITIMAEQNLIVEDLQFLMDSQGHLILADPTEIFSFWQDKTSYIFNVNYFIIISIAMFYHNIEWSQDSEKLIQKIIEIFFSYSFEKALIKDLIKNLINFKKRNITMSKEKMQRTLDFIEELKSFEQNSSQNHEEQERTLLESFKKFLSPTLENQEKMETGSPPEFSLSQKEIDPQLLTKIFEIKLERTTVYSIKGVPDKVFFRSKHNYDPTKLSQNDFSKKLDSAGMVNIKALKIMDIRGLPDENGFVAEIKKGSDTLNYSDLYKPFDNTSDVLQNEFITQKTLIDFYNFSLISEDREIYTPIFAKDGSLFFQNYVSSATLESDYVTPNEFLTAIFFKIKNKDIPWNMENKKMFKHLFMNFVFTNRLQISDFSYAIVDHLNESYRVSRRNKSLSKTELFLLYQFIQELTTIKDSLLFEKDDDKIVSQTFISLDRYLSEINTIDFDKKNQNFSFQLIHSLKDIFDVKKSIKTIETQDILKVLEDLLNYRSNLDILNDQDKFFLESMSLIFQNFLLQSFLLERQSKTVSEKNPFKRKRFALALEEREFFNKAKELFFHNDLASFKIDLEKQNNFFREKIQLKKETLKKKISEIDYNKFMTTLNKYS